MLELVSNNVMEPLLYGHSVGLSSLAVIVAAIFWTWLWGAVGLVIATPITACLVVLSTYVPALASIGRLLGERPALKPHESLYQRLLARDVDEARGIVARYRKEHSLDEACQLVLDALLALKRDLQADRIPADDGVFVIDNLGKSIEALRTHDAPAAYDPTAPPPVLLMGVPGNDPLDALVLELARVLLREEPATPRVVTGGAHDRRSAGGHRGESARGRRDSVATPGGAHAGAAPLPAFARADPGAEARRGPARRS